MSDEDPIVNRVADSDLITFDLEQYHRPGTRVVLDIKEQLFQGLVLREKEFREYIKGQDWTAYDGKYVAVTCSADAIVPTWAYMLLAAALTDHARLVVFGKLEDLETRLYLDALSGEDWSAYEGRRVVVKGCSKVEVPAAIYVEVAGKLRPYVASLMFGEACSTVPLFKDRQRVGVTRGKR